MKPKLLVILGPTATGKSSLAVKLAKKYNGEVISADSRQVYKGLDIGTGKITKREMCGIPHHMIDRVSPKKTYTVSEWQEEARFMIDDILRRGKLPILCGGTGFYIDSIVTGIILPEVPPNKLLRKELSHHTLEGLIRTLQRLDPERLKSIDVRNPVRLIRAIEIAYKLGVVPRIRNQKSSYEFLQIGLNLPPEELRKKIHLRLLSRIKKGMFKEAQKLHSEGLSWKRMRALGLEYRYLADFLENKISKADFVEKLEGEIWKYAKRQMTWFKRSKEIHWDAPQDFQKIDLKVRNFLG